MRLCVFGLYHVDEPETTVALKYYENVIVGTEIIVSAKAKTEEHIVENKVFDFDMQHSGRGKQLLVHCSTVPGRTRTVVL